MSAYLRSLEDKMEKRDFISKYHFVLDIYLKHGLRMSEFISYYYTDLFKSPDDMKEFAAENKDLILNLFTIESRNEKYFKTCDLSSDHKYLCSVNIHMKPYFKERLQ